MKAIATQTGEFILATAVVWITTLQELDHLSDDIVQQLVNIGAAEYVEKPKRYSKKPGPTEFKKNEKED